MSATRELQAIIEARSHGAPAALVTVVKTAGSVYRRPGARMFVDTTGRTVGSISGGCLEDDAREHALTAIASGRATVVRYDTTADGDIIFGSGLGCQGVVHVLIEPLPAPGRDADPLALIAGVLRDRRGGALATVFETEPPPGHRQDTPAIGSFVWLNDLASDAIPTTTIANPTLAAAIAVDARAALFQGRPGLHTYPLADGGRAEVFVDAIRPARALLICGAGHDAAPLAQLGKEMGWRVRVVDGRRAYLVRSRFPDVDELIHCPASEFGSRIGVEPGEAAVLMTHNYLHDRDILRALLPSSVAYLGVLGPRLRTERLLAELAAADDQEKRLDLGKFSLRRLHSPVGLDIGAESPEQIALSIVAEIEAVCAGREGGPLKHRRGPLHDSVL